MRSFTGSLTSKVAGQFFDVIPDMHFSPQIAPSASTRTPTRFGVVSSHPTMARTIATRSTIEQHAFALLGRRVCAEAVRHCAISSAFLQVVSCYIEQSRHSGALDWSCAFTLMPFLLRHAARLY